MDDLDEIIIKEENKEEIIDFKKIRNLINHYILTYTKEKTEPVNNIRELKQTILTLLGYAHTIVSLYEENEDERRKILDEIDKIENEIYKIEENIASKDKSVAYYNLIKNDYDEILDIFRKYLSEKGGCQKLDAYHQQNRQSPIIHS
jgi:replicative DNA helicase